MKKATINIASPRPAIRSIFIIYTGGTLGMSYDESGKHLIPFDFDLILENIPELRRFEYELTVLSLPEIIDSSNMRPQLWIE
ncbi:MAG: asparaginase domain-containing protein, partial [Bacteroidota bacterium]